MIKYRGYDNYEEYLQHQQEKLDKGIRKKKKRFDPSDFKRITENFKKRLEVFVPYLSVSNKILCMGARLGMEVRAFREMGFRDSIGIDLNPGPWQDKKDPLVIKGDFHHTDFIDNTFDVVYSNSIDHCYDIRLLNKEISRILNKNGKLLLEVAHLSVSDKKKTGYISSPTKYESCIYDTVNDIESCFINFATIKSYDIKDSKWVVLVLQNEK